MTLNLKDFPKAALEPFGLIALHPDDFIVAQLDLDLYPALAAFKGLRARKKKPSLGALEYALALERNGLPSTAARLSDAAALI